MIAKAAALYVGPGLLNSALVRWQKHGVKGLVRRIADAAPLKTPPARSRPDITTVVVRISSFAIKD